MQFQSLALLSCFNSDFWVCDALTLLITRTKFLVRKLRCIHFKQVNHLEVGRKNEIRKWYGLLWEEINDLLRDNTIGKHCPLYYFLCNFFESEFN